MWVAHRDFNSRTSCEVRPLPTRGLRKRFRFQLTHLLRGATQTIWRRWRCFRFQLTHLLRGATIPTAARAGIVRFQLTHLLRGATPDGLMMLAAWTFQLTHLLRGATHPGQTPTRSIPDFNSRTSCEVRRRCTAALLAAENFNSRTSCEVRLPARIPACLPR